MNAAFRACSMTHFHWGNGVLRYRMNGQEKDGEIADGIYTAEFWEYDSRLGRRWNVDPKPSVYYSGYSCFSNSPFWMHDPEGDTSRIYDSNGVFLEEINDGPGLRYLKVDASRYWTFKHNYADNEIAKDPVAGFYGPLATNPDYASVFINTYVASEQMMGTKNLNNANAYVMVSTTAKMEMIGTYDPETRVAGGRLEMRVTFIDGSNLLIAMTSVQSGGYGNGPLENGSYSVDNPMSPSRSNSPGMTGNGPTNGNGINFSIDVTPAFETKRTELRIHPDGNNFGTKGCIGVESYADQFYSVVSRFIRNNGAVTLDVNVAGNPNNNGTKSKLSKTDE